MRVSTRVDRSLEYRRVASTLRVRVQDLYIILRNYIEFRYPPRKPHKTILCTTQRRHETVIATKAGVVAKWRLEILQRAAAA